MAALMMGMAALLYSAEVKSQRSKVKSVKKKRYDYSCFPKYMEEKASCPAWDFLQNSGKPVSRNKVASESEGAGYAQCRWQGSRRCGAS